MRRSSFLLLLSAIISFLSLPAAAQRSAPQPPAAAPPASSRSGGFRVSANGLPDQYSLLLRDEVGKELKLTEMQRLALDDIRREASEKVLESREKLRERFEEIRAASAEERTRLMQELSRATRDETEANGKRVAALLSGAQKARLAELWIQYQGEAALQADADVIASLKLTDEQLEKMRPAIGPLSRRSNAEREAGLAKALEVLTEEQRAKFDELRGKQFEFADASSRFGAGRGGLGGGGFGGGGGFRGRAPAGAPPAGRFPVAAARAVPELAELVRRMDNNGNGMLDLNEGDGRLADLVNRALLADGTLDPFGPVPMDKVLEAIERYRKQRSEKSGE